MHFIYVFKIEDRDRLIGMGYQLVGSDDKNNIFAFACDSSDVAKFADMSMPYIFSNKLTYIGG